VKQTGFSLKKCLIIFACLAIHPFVTSWFSTYIIAGFVLILILVIQGYLQLICWQPLIFLGAISYSLYLTHQNIGYVVIRSLSRLGINSNTSVFIAIVVAIALAAAITTLVEQPALHYIRDQYRRRFLKVAARQP
jgi:peptidoglycan/LPS O-acetylase OafA/YrhL